MGSLTEWVFAFLFFSTIFGIPFILNSDPKTYEDSYKQEYFKCLKINEGTKEIPNIENYCSYYAASRMK